MVVPIKKLSKHNKTNFHSTQLYHWIPNSSTALKIIKNPNENAWNEVELLKKTHQHQNVINYYHSFKDSNTGDLCIVMEFCDKGSLANYIPKVR